MIMWELSTGLRSNYFIISLVYFKGKNVKKKIAHCNILSHPCNKTNTIIIFILKSSS